MIFKKPEGVRYVDMAMYIDEHVYEPNHDEAKIFEYLYHLFYILAVKKCYFKVNSDYDNYALFGAEAVYIRLTNKKQFLPDGDPHKLKKIKSCLNYIKRVLFALKVDYQNSEFREVISGYITQDKSTDDIKKMLEDKASNNYCDQLEVEVTYYLNRITRTIKTYLKDIPFSADKLLMKNIYMSCILTFLNSITWSNANKAKVDFRVNKNLSVTDTVNKIYEQESEDVILYHLDQSMRTYIKVLVNRIKALVAKDLRALIGYNEPTPEVMKSIIASPLADSKEVQDYD